MDIGSGHRETAVQKVSRKSSPEAGARILVLVPVIDGIEGIALLQEHALGDLGGQRNQLELVDNC